MNGRKINSETGSRRRGPAGFTVIELLVVVAIIGLLTALVVPAVMSSRSAARRLSCQNNLKQVGLAIHNIAAARGRLPAGLSEYRTTGSDAANGWSPHAQLLDYLDQAPLADTLDLAEPFKAGHQSDLGSRPGTVVPTFACPEDPVTGGNNYRFNTGRSLTFDSRWGPGLDEPPDDLPGGPFGPFGLWTQFTTASIRDGVSNTAAVSEKRKSGPADGFDPAADVWFTNLLAVAGADPDVLRSACDRDVTSPSQYYADVGRTWAAPSYYHTWYNHALPPNPGFPDCSMQGSDLGYRPDYGGFYPATSDHRGGVNLLLLDGSARFVSDAVDPATWAALGTRAAGDVTGEF